MDAGTLSYLTERYRLLVTKLYIPRPDTELLARPHLIERLNQASNQPLVVIAAPAGWDKTTLVASWVRQAGRRIEWFLLDEEDNDLALLVASHRRPGTIFNTELEKTCWHNASLYLPRGTAFCTII